MIRSAKLSLKFITKSKQLKLQALVSRYRSAVNWYIKWLWDGKNKLDKDTYKLIINCNLNARLKQMALKQAKEIVFGTKRLAKKQHKQISKPHFSGSLVLDQRVINITIDKPGPMFDVYIRCNTLRYNGRIDLPLKRTKVLNKWLEKPGAKLRKSILLDKKWIKLMVELPESANRNTKTLGIDLGINKIISDSDGNHYGKDFKKLLNRIRNRKFKSATRSKIMRARDNYLNWAVNQLPWNEIKIIGMENLKNLKKGKHKSRSKQFRKAMAPWTYRQVLNRISQKAQEHGVQLVKVNPAYTSQTCPSCQLVSKENRCGEIFKCTACKYQDDADTNGAKNILQKTLETLGCL